jgi:hypothetical protein
MRVVDCPHLLSPEMAAEARDRGTKGACDVFLSHAGEQKKAYVDCLYQILVHVGGRGLAKPRQRCIEVFLDQHGLQPGATAWAVVEEKARNCRIGESHQSSRHALKQRQSTTPKTTFDLVVARLCAEARHSINPFWNHYSQRTDRAQSFSSPAPD